MDDNESIIELVLHYVRGIWKNRWIAIAIAWPLLIVGVIVVDQITDRYTAHTKVYINSSSVFKPLLKGLAIESDFEATVRLMARTLLSRPNLERAARLVDMDIEVETPEQMEQLLKKIRSRVEISASKRTGTYTISYSDEDRLLAKRMVQTLLDIFIEDTLGKSSTDSDTAISFLNSQINKYDELLQDAEQRREAFKRKNIGLMPKDGANYYTQLQDVNGLLEEAIRSIGEYSNRRDKIKSQLNSLTFSDTSDSIASSYDKRISLQELKLEDLLLLYTDEHPDVINAQLVLNSLNDRRKKELEGLQNNSQLLLTDNPVQQELQILLTQTEAELSSLQARVSSFGEKKTQLEQLVDIVPKIEAELLRLDRDYNVHKKNYTDLVKRREQARIAEDVASGADQEKFRIMEPAFVPLQADYPNRVLLDFYVLILALGVGYGAGFLISLFQPVFYSQNELRNFFDYAVLGAVSKFDTVKVIAKRRANVLLFSFANLLLISTAIMMMLIHNMGFLVYDVFQTRVMGL